ncbi:MurR/RpiR family transcriptional regulator [Streptomyces sp. NPDC051940]|uniref:MurR/RpiR family transcriptional regulator n=1 Tax=Streptomyces sp. NPDC051940 TaxID=3155675 RepID=UPI003443F785
MANASSRRRRGGDDTPQQPAPEHKPGPDQERSTMPPSVLVQIRALLPSLPPSERRVAEATVADPVGVAGLTISELASQCDTSETTVIRFCRAVGLKGYPELRIKLAAAGGSEDLGGPAWSSAGSEIGPEDSLADMVGKLGFADARAVQETVAQLDLTVLERAIDEVLRAGCIDLYGVGASALIALDLQQKLHRIGYRATVWSDADGALTSAALLGRGDLAIGVSHTGTTTDTVAALAEASENGASTLAITNFPLSPIAETADMVLTTAARETAFRTGAISSRIAALTVVDCLFVGVAQRNHGRTTRALERTYAAVQRRRAPK